MVLTIDIDNSTTNVGLFDQNGMLRFRSGLITSRNPTRDQCAINLMNLFTLYHADLREDYLGAKLSHACVIRRCHDLLGDGRIHQFCIRSGDREEFRFAQAHTELHLFNFDGLKALTEALAGSGAPVYLTIDLDCLDPAAFPGTGTPEAGGITFPQLLEAIRLVCRTNVVAADVNELAPMLDHSGASTAVACKVLRELLLALSK